MRLKKAILNTMSADQLKSVIYGYELQDSVDMRCKDDMQSLLSRKRNITPEVLFDYLYESEVKQVCDDLKISSRGRKNELIGRLLKEAGRNNKPKTISNSNASQISLEPHKKLDIIPAAPRKPSRNLRMKQQSNIGLEDVKPSSTNVDSYTFEPIQGYPMLNWRGKRPFRSTQYYPAQLKEVHGPEVDGWRNKIYWGDNLQVLSHLLKDYRGQVKLAYIDPPFDSKADYRKRIHKKEKEVKSDYLGFEEKQYGDIWTNDEYLQFMYERLCLIRELLSETGSIWVHCDWHRSHHLRCLLDEVFGQTNLQNEVIWQRTDPHNDAKSRLGWIHDTIFWYAKKREAVVYNWQNVTTQLSDAAIKEYSLVKLKSGAIIRWSAEPPVDGRRFKLDDCTYKGTDIKRRFVWRGAKPSNKRVWPYVSPAEMDAAVDRGEFYLRNPDKGAARCRVSYLDQRGGQVLQTIWTDCGRMKGGVDYPTQKPEQLLERIILSCTNKDEIVLDCFMGSGTTLVASDRHERRYLGADINLGAVQHTTSRLLRDHS